MKLNAPLFLSMALLATSANAANFVVVTDDPVADAPLLNHLENYLGHTVTSTGSFAELASGSPEVATLNAADMVIVSRTTSSGAYDGETVVQAWDSVTSPILLGNAWITRNNRWLWVDTDSVQEAYDGDISDPVGAAETHPLFANLTPDVGDPIDGAPISGIAKYDWTSDSDIPNGSIIMGDGEVIGVRNNATAPNIVVASWDAGDMTGSGNVLAGNRYFYGMPQAWGSFRNSGIPLFNNILSLEFPVLEGDVDLDGDIDLQDFAAIRDNFGDAVAERALGDLTFDGVVDFNDFNLWKNAVGPEMAALADWSTSAPEPGTFALAAGALCLLSTRARRGRRDRC